MQRLATLLGLTFVCTACDHRTYSVSELPDVDIRVAAAHPVDEPSGPDGLVRVTVDVAYDAEKFGGVHDAACAVFKDIEGDYDYETFAEEHATLATFDDAYMEMTDPGGIDESGACRPPRFEVDWQVRSGRETEVELAIRDDHGPITAQLYRSLLDPRRATLISHDTWTFAAGDVVTLAWSHRADTATDFEVWLEGAEPVLLATVRPVDELLTFSIPSPPPVTGGMLVHIVGADYQRSGGAGGCYNARSCRWAVPEGYRHQIEIH
jgi:hypothetical protein